MSKIFKKLTAATIAGVMAMGMAAPAYAITTPCNHMGKVYTQELEPHYTYEQHSNGHGGICTITTKYRVILVSCASCGLLNTQNITQKFHSDTSCTNK